MRMNTELTMLFLIQNVDKRQESIYKALYPDYIQFVYLMYLDNSVAAE